jgi:hypothetical protein
VTTKTVKKWRDAGLLTGEIANDKGEYFYHLPGPDFTRPRIGRRPRSDPAATLTKETTTTSQEGSAV